MMPIIKRCGCGREYDRATWACLDLMYREHFDSDRWGPETNIEYRNCWCGSTIGVDMRAAREYMPYRDEYQ